MTDVAARINQLKKERNAVILAHNYQVPEVQDVSDFQGDSLALSIKASKTDADVIIFCGVFFMAETAKILSPDKKVITPDRNAGCPMADMISAGHLREFKKEYPGAKTLCYVNSTAEVKAESDICCTSSNVLKIIENAFEKDEDIIFVPDKNLAMYAARKLNRKIIYWPGYCPPHARIIPEYIMEKKKEHPYAEVLVHPECSPEVIELADQVLSTGGMAKYVSSSKNREFIIGTEEGMTYPLKKHNPDKEFYLASDISICPNMKKITLDKVLRSLENMTTEIWLSDDVISRAKNSILRMLEYS